MSPARIHSRPLGFTLPEVMAAMLILSLLAVMAVPMLRGLLHSYRIKTASFELFVTLNLARSEAIKRAAPVTVAPNGASWAAGWRIRDADGKVIKLRPALSEGVVISGPDSLVFEKDGRLPKAGDTAAFDVSITDSADSATGRCVRVDLAGRPATQKGGC